MTNDEKRVLMTQPHDGHPDTEVCPGCPHPTPTEVAEHDGGRIGCNHAGGRCSETPDGTWPPTNETKAPTTRQET